LKGLRKLEKIGAKRSFAVKSFLPRFFEKKRAGCGAAPHDLALDLDLPGDVCEVLIWAE